MEEGLTCAQICDKYHAIHRSIYEWFDCEFDNFGRTPTRAQTEICQEIYRDIDAANCLVEKEVLPGPLRGPNDPVPHSLHRLSLPQDLHFVPLSFTESSSFLQRLRLSLHGTPLSSRPSLTCSPMPSSEP